MKETEQTIFLLKINLVIKLYFENYVLKSVIDNWIEAGDRSYFLQNINQSHHGLFWLRCSIVTEMTEFCHGVLH